MLGIPSTTYYRWYDRWSEGGFDALDDTRPIPGLSGTASRMRPERTLSSSRSSMKT
jgi:hypothetical protein